MVSDSQFFAGITGDVSMGGIFVATYRKLPVGARVSIRFSIDDDRFVIIDGTVRWLREASMDTPPGLGIQFDRLSGEALRDISTFCQHRQPLYHEHDD